MGNIIAQATNNANSYGIDDKGNLSMNANSTFTAQTGVFNKGVQFNDIIDAKGTATFAKGVTFNSDVTTTTINGVDITKLNSTVSGLSSGAGIGSFTGTVSAGAFTGSSATFDNITVNTLGNLSKQLKIQGSTGSNINLSNGGTINAETGEIRNIVSNGINTLNITGTNGYFSQIYGANISSFYFTGAMGNFSNISTASNMSGYNNSFNNNGLYIYGGRGIEIITEPNNNNLINATGTLSYFKTVNAGTGSFTGTVTANSIDAVSGKFSSNLTAASLSLSSTGTVNMTGYTLSARNGEFSNNLTLSGGTGTASMTGYSLFAGTGTFSGTVSASSFTGTSINASTGTFTGLLTASSFTGTSINASTGTFTGLTASSFTGTSINASNGTFTGGISLPTGANFNLIGNMTGTGQINASNCTFSGSGAFGSLTSTNMISAIGGIQIGSSVNKWQIKESTGPTGAGLLCFAKNGLATPYACIDTSGNLVAGTGYTVPI